MIFVENIIRNILFAIQKICRHTIKEDKTGMVPQILHLEKRTHAGQKKSNVQSSLLSHLIITKFDFYGLNCNEHKFLGFDVESKY